MSAWRSRDRRDEPRVDAAASGAKRVTTSTSPRRRHVVISRPSSPCASSAIRSVSAISDSGIPIQPQHLLAQLDGARDSRARMPAVATAAGHIALQLARRPGEHDDRRAAVDRRTTRPGAVPTGSSTVAPAGTTACLRFDARIASGSRSGQRDISGRRISAIRSSKRLVEDHLAPRERPDDLGGQVVGRRPQPAAGDDQVDAARRQEAQRLRHVLAAVADDERVGVLDAERAQALGQPRPVAVADAAR